MKYDKLTIIGLPKKFKVYYALDYLYPNGQLPDNPDDILYDEWPADGEEGEDAMMVYEYYKSATGIYIAYNETVHALSFRQSYVKRLLKTKEGFTLEGLFHGFTLKVAHLRPALTLDIQARKLRQLFADMQWEKE